MALVLQVVSENCSLSAGSRCPRRQRISGPRATSDDTTPPSPFCLRPISALQLLDSFGSRPDHTPVLNARKHDQERLQILDFLSRTLQESFEHQSLESVLADGVVPCRIIDKISPSTNCRMPLQYLVASRSENIQRFEEAHQRLTATATLKGLHLENQEACFVRLCQALLQLQRLSAPEDKTKYRSPIAQPHEVPSAAQVPAAQSPQRLHTEFYVPNENISIRRPSLKKLHSAQAQGSLRCPASYSRGVVDLDATKTCRSSIAARNWAPKPRAISMINPTPPGTPLSMPLDSPRRSLSHVSPVSLTPGSVTIDGSATYLLGNVIGRGQFGIVYRAIDNSTGRIVAVKQIPLEDKIMEEVDKLMQEVHLLRELQSPQVVKYEGFVRSENFLSIVIEYVENGSLLNTIRTFGCFKENLCARYTRKILDGLIYLHSKDVVHCDIKLANVLSTKSGDIKLTDFGVSINMSGESTIQGGVNGTPNWLAPEVITLRGTSKASDIWALGCTVLEMITGRPPYSRQNAMSVLFSIVEDPHPPMPGDLSRELTDFLMSCFKKEPRARSSARELRCHPWIVLHQAADSVTRPLSATAYNRKASSTIELVASIAHRQIPVRNRKRSDSDQAKIKRSSTMHERRSECPASTRPSTAPIATSLDTRRLMVMQAHQLTKSHFKHEVSCSICKRLMVKALYCDACHVVAHPDCLLATAVPCKTVTLVPPPAASARRRLSSAMSMKHQPFNMRNLLRPMYGQDQGAWQLRKKSTKEACVIM